MGQIQNSMNQLFAASMGMGYAISQHPATKNYVENKQLNKKGEAAGKAFTEFANKASDGSLGTDEILTDIAADMSKKSYKDRIESAQTPKQFEKAFEGRLINEKQLRELRESLDKQREAEAKAPTETAEEDDTLELLKELGVDVDNINVGISRVRDGKRYTEGTRTRNGRVLDPEAILMERYENATAAKNAVKNRRELIMTAKQWMDGGLDG